MSAPTVTAPATAGGGVPVGGSGAAGYVAKWTAATTLGGSTTTGATASLYVDATGNVGIGTASPAEQLAVKGPSYVDSVVDILSLQNPSATNAGVRISLRNVYGDLGGVKARQTDNGAGANDGVLELQTSTDAVLSTKMTILSGGDVGIGTASPAGRLDVVGVAGLSWAIRAQVNSANTSPALNAELGFNLKNASATVGNYTSITNRDNADNANTQINFININSSGSGAINFVTRDSVGGAFERARFDATGNFGIGTASPTGRLHVVGGTAAAATNGAPVTIIAQSAGTGNQNGGNIVLTPGALSGIGSAGVADLSGPTGTGLKLPATPGNIDTQTLDCYAEGTWTPTLTGFGGTAPTATARYTRIGRLVSLQVKLSAVPATTFSSAAGGTYISLPTGMTAAVEAPGSTSTSGIAADGSCVAYTNGNFYLPTFALRSADTFLNVTYTV